MRSARDIVLLLAGFALLQGCATGKPEELRSAPEVTKMHEQLGCRSDEVAVCIDVDCEPEDYVCTRRTDFRDAFEPKIKF